MSGGGHDLDVTVRFCNEFPMTVNGKAQTFTMRETSVEELGLMP